MLKDYANENWEEEYREDIDNVNGMYEFVAATLLATNIVGSATINGKIYVISEGGN